jgi:hypothetical protein
MPDKYLKAFIDELPQMDDEALLKTLVRFHAAPGGYRPEAIAAAGAEMERRGLTLAQLDDATNQATQDRVKALFGDAVRLAEDGRSADQIQAHLKARGLDDGTAAGMAQRAWDMPADQRRRAGRRNVISGTAVCVLGLLVTAVTYVVAASSPGGGPYVIAWGVVLVGVVQLLRGLGQLNR